MDHVVKMPRAMQSVLSIGMSYERGRAREVSLTDGDGGFSARNLQLFTAEHGPNSVSIQSFQQPPKVCSSMGDKSIVVWYVQSHSRRCMCSSDR